jgi:hypothetical protein
VQVESNQNPPAIKIFVRGLTAAQCSALADIITFAPGVIWELVNPANSQWLSIGGSNPPYDFNKINGYCNGGNPNNIMVAVMYKMK